LKERISGKAFNMGGGLDNSLSLLFSLLESITGINLHFYVVNSGIR